MRSAGPSGKRCRACRSPSQKGVFQRNPCYGLTPFLTPERRPMPRDISGMIAVLTQLAFRCRLVAVCETILILMLQGGMSLWWIFEPKRNSSNPRIVTASASLRQRRNWRRFLRMHSIRNEPWTPPKTDTRDCRQKQGLQSAPPEMTKPKATQRND